VLSTLPVDATAPPEAELGVPDLQDRLRSSRQLSLTLAAPLSDEDQTVQPMDDASPTKWHLAHTTWFYESFILKPNLPDYRPFSADFEYCFEVIRKNEIPIGDALTDHFILFPAEEPLS